METIKWGKSADGNVESKGGEYRIMAVKQGVQQQSRYRPGHYRLSEKIVGYALICQIQNIGFVCQSQTQGSAKKLADLHIRKIR
tara:strand:- start:257 stop:508 length:252 start_codon:yes stop_codon:yes gene_type:complete